MKFAVSAYGIGLNIGGVNKMESNVHKWDAFYEKIPTYHHAPESYIAAAKFLESCTTVEDWGCGGGGFMKYRPDAIGVDGSDTPHARKRFVDLTTYTTTCEGIHIRHVFEHNYEWAKILKNALTSATKKIAITFFIPLAQTLFTSEIRNNATIGINVPDLRIAETEFKNILDRFTIANVQSVILENSATQYHTEQMIFITL